MKKKEKPPAPGRKIVAALFLAIAVAILGLFAYSAVLARIVHVERTIISAKDLPAALDGIKILYVSDIDMVGLTSPRGVARLFDRLQALEPDVLILGGDYAGYSLMNRMNGTGSEVELAEKRRALFSALADFDAPLGKFAVAGENDAGAEDLQAELALGGITLLSDSYVAIERDGARIALVGLAEDAGANMGAIAEKFTKSDYVIVVAHNPARIADVLTAEAKDSGAWCDLMLTGHTHGGQAVLFGRTLVPLTVREARYLSGWRKETGSFVLVSEGLGCESVNLRFGTRAEVHLITLRTAAE